MLRIGLTGGIGSGKSTIARVFETLGIPVYYADAAAKRLMLTNETLKSDIIQHFGSQAYVDGALNRSYLAGIVFNDAYQLNLLNNLVHPVTIQDATQWMQAQQAPYIIKEAALLFESYAKEGLSFIIGVSAPRHLRIQRVMQRDAVTKDEVEKRMQRQIDESIKMKLCDFVITNDEQQLVVPQVLKLHQHFIHLEASGLNKRLKVGGGAK
jgi:dephospho-CoA kinase